jgi:magnesium transporter
MIIDCAHYRDGRRQHEGPLPFVILRTARYDDAREEVEFGEITIFLGPPGS